MFEYFVSYVEGKEYRKRKKFCQKVEEFFPEILIKCDLIRLILSSLKLFKRRIDSKCKNVFIYRQSFLVFEHSMVIKR